MTQYFVVLLLCMLVSVPAHATQLPAADDSRPTIRAVRLNPDEKMTVDGRLDEPVWERAIPATDFRQSDPRNGEPASERTEIRIAFSQDSLYIGGQFYDSDPSGMLGNQMVR